MKVNLSIRMHMVQLEIGDHLDPKLHSKQRWRTRWGSFPRTAGPGAQKNFELPPFVQAAKDELAAIIAQHGVEALAGSVEIVMEDVPKG